MSSDTESAEEIRNSETTALSNSHRSTFFEILTMSKRVGIWPYLVPGQRPIWGLSLEEFTVHIYRLKAN